MEKLKVMLDDGAYMPIKAHDIDAGFDLRSPMAVFIPAGGSVTIDTGVHVEIPQKPLCVGMLKSKSGLNVRHSITTEGVIDAGYTGSVCVKMSNHGTKGYYVEIGDKITQLVIMPIYPVSECEQVDGFGDSERGAAGFGSSGR